MATFVLVHGSTISLVPETWSRRLGLGRETKGDRLSTAESLRQLLR
jgi:hypothetical protein